MSMINTASDNVGILIFMSMINTASEAKEVYELDKFHAQLSWV